MGSYWTKVGNFTKIGGWKKEGGDFFKGLEKNKHTDNKQCIECDIHPITIA